MTKVKDIILNKDTSAEQPQQKYQSVLTPQQSAPQTISNEMEQRGKELMREDVAKTPAKQIMETKPAERKYDTYEEMYKAMNVYTPPTTEELEAEKKRRKRNAILNAVGDGISSLANLYYTTKGAPAVKNDPRASLSERSRARWDYLDKVRGDKTQQYIRGLAEAKAADKRQADADKKWREQMNLSLKLADEREELAALKAKLDAEEAAKKREYTTSEREAKQDFTAEQNEANRQAKITTAQISQAGQNKRAEMSAETKNITNIQKAEGKNMPFYDGEGNVINVSESVWKTSRGQVLDAMKEDGIEPNTYEKGYNEEQFIKNNWYKSPSAVEKMKELQSLKKSRKANPMSSTKKPNPMAATKKSNPMND